MDCLTSVSANTQMMHAKPDMQKRIRERMATLVSTPLFIQYHLSLAQVIVKHKIPFFTKRHSLELFVWGQYLSPLTVF